MFRITFKEHGGDWEVWASLQEPSDDFPIERMPESFILGTGATPADAKQQALGALVDAQVQIFAWRAEK